MSSGHRKNSASAAESRPMGLGGRCKGDYSNTHAYTHSNSNSSHKLESSGDEPPSYEMSNNAMDQSNIPLANLRAPSAEGQQSQVDANLYQQPVIQPAQDNRPYGFLRRSQFRPLLSFNFSLPGSSFGASYSASYSFNSPTSNVSFNLNFKYAILVALILGLCIWVFWGRS